ncbi:hypothetical protein TSAR_013960 [Trichomalopsis sarcophagae]|uniref:Uncharacterized protein n=1 Tax=Trichomalopsis sarcophagae TaxID=543379 RepID=A0A232F9T2_9HYME|nr:hypothetical protein TSAR_013960 [Trichomalopsis sarcophagae]
MKCQVLPAAELSYCVKCVAVESERVFGDVVVTRRSSAAQLPAAYQRSRQNLVQQYLEGPNFLELNRRRPMRRQSAAVAEEGKRDSELKLVARSTRSKSLNLQGTWLGPDLTEHDRTLKLQILRCVIETSIERSKNANQLLELQSYPCIQRNNSAKARTPTQPLHSTQTYPAAPLPSQYSATKEIVVSSLVDQLLVDIYGPTTVSLCGSEWRTRSGSESTNSSWKSRHHQQPYLQRTRLELKSNGELRIVLGTLRDHVSHTGSLLVRQLRRREYLLSRREKLYNVITAHLQAHSSKRKSQQYTIHLCFGSHNRSNAHTNV